MALKYKRILLKLSGEALMGDKKSGLDESVLESYARQIKEIQDMGAQVGIVIGGGNIFRGLSGLKSGFDRVTGDYMGMLATVINGLALQTFINQAGGKARVLTAIEMLPVAERYTKTLTEDIIWTGICPDLYVWHRKSVFHHRYGCSTERCGDRSRSNPQRNTGGWRLYGRSGKGSRGR